MKMKYTPTICPYCGCGCGLNLVTVNGRVKGVEPWKRNPVNHGKLCPKGNFCHEFIHHPDRLFKPLMKGKNGLKEVEWNEALEKIATRLVAMKNDDPDSIAFLASARCTNEDNYLLQKFARLVIGTNNIGNCADLCHGPSVAGLSLTLGSGAMTNSMEDLEESDCIFIIGSNTLEQHPLIGRRVLRAKNEGAKLIVADPRFTITAKHADLYLPLEPGRDIALINSMMHVILSESLEDQKFINERTKNFEKLKDVINDYPPEIAEDLTGIPADKIIKSAIYYGEANTASILYSMGVTQHKHGTDNVKSLSNLALLTGNMGKKGAGVNPLRGQNNVQGACDMGGLPLFFPGYQKLVLDPVRDKIESKWGCNSLSGVPGLQLVEIMDAIYDGSIRGMYIMGENPMVSDPELGHIQKSLEKLELLVVQDIFLTETAEFADFILPSSSWAEKEGTFTSTERRVQRIRKATAPPGEAREDWAIIRDLAKKMGSNKFEYNSALHIFEEIRKVTPQYEGITSRKLEKAGGVQWPCPLEKHPGTQVMHQETFPTNDGKGSFIPVHFKADSKIRSYEYPFILTTGRVIFQYQTGTMTRRSKTLDKQSPEAYVEINKEDANDLDIKNRELLKIYTKQGVLSLKAKKTADIKRGVLFIPFHFAEMGVNVLTSGEFLDPVSKMPEFKVSAARIEKIS
jgi:formate dehydrogenase (coenzyme F420) alpha subunit